MLRSYFLTAYRNLIRNKEYSLINIVGLAVSIASCLVLFSIIQYELSFDTFHAKRDRIYRITNEVNEPEGVDYGDGVPVPLPDALRTDFQQFEQVGTIFSLPGSQIDVLDARQKEELKFREELGVFFAEPEFFNIFDFGWLHGSPDVLSDPNVAVLTQEIAEKYFGEWRHAIGKSIEYQNSTVLKVGGILKNIPVTSDFPLKVAISYKTRGQEPASWGRISSRRQCFVLLGNHASLAQIESLMPAFEDRHQPADLRDHYTFQPLKDLHFDARYGNFNGRIVSKTTLLALGLIGLLLIITASINFINLAIAQVMKRSKEVGVRKVLGSKRRQLSGQFFGETFLIMVVASLLAVVFTQAALPSLRQMLNLPASFQTVSSLQAILFLGSITLVVTVISGFYPARVLSGFKPVQALKSKISNQTVGGVSLRKSLVVVQFAIAQILVIATLVIFQQIEFFRTAPLGFDKDSILQFPVPTDSLNQTKIEAFRNQLLQEPGVENVTFNFNPPLSKSTRKLGFRFDHSHEEAPFELNVKFVDVEYFATYNLSLAAGRIYQPSDTPREYVVNETFLRKFGIQNPEDGLGKVITRGGVSLPIVGVLKDFHLLSLQEEIEPIAMMCNKAEYRYAGVKLETDNLKVVTQKIGRAYLSFFPDNIFEYTFFDESVARQYEAEERLSSITKIFSCIAIFVSALGLYGLISFMAVQRTKEVGIRKVLGASVRDIVVLFQKEFVFLVLVAFAVSAPLTGYFMSDWLNTFAYKVSLSAWIFIVAIVLSILISVITISFRSIKAALANPVDSLRSE